MAYIANQLPWWNASLARGGEADHVWTTHTHDAGVRACARAPRCRALAAVREA